MKKTLTALLAILTVVSSMCVSALTLDTAETGDAKAYEQAVLSENSEYGILVNEKTFDNASSWPDSTSMAISGVTLAHNVAAMSPSLADDPDGNGGKALKITKTGQYSQFMFYFNYGQTKGLGYDMPGKYTFVYDIYYPAVNEADATTLITPNPMIGMAQNRVANTISKASVYSQNDRGTWKTITQAFTIVTKNEAELSGITFDSADKGSTVFPTAHINGFYPGDYSAASNGKYLTFYIDNVRLYYKASPNITYDFSESPVMPSMVQSVGKTAFNEKCLNVSFAEGTELPVLACDSFVFLGWSKDPYGDSGFVTEAENAKYSVYPIWSVQDTTEVSVNTASAFAAGSGNVFRLSACVDEIEWKADFGNTDITAFSMTEGRNAEITVGNKAGEITVWFVYEGVESDKVKLNVYNSKVTVPGINLFNGLETPVDFENGLALGVNGVTDDAVAAVVSDVPSDVSGNSSAKALRNETNGTMYVNYKYYIPLENGRKYHYSGKFFRDFGSTANHTSNWLLYVMSSSHHQFSIENDLVSWHSFATDFTPNRDFDPTKSTLTHQQSCAGTPTAGNIYIDDVMFMPYYKITYTGIDTPEFYLFDDNGNVAKSYTIDKTKVVKADGKKLIGWSTVENATEVMKSVALNNEDIVLYPVWEDADTEDETEAKYGILLLEKTYDNATAWYDNTAMTMPGYTLSHNTQYGTNSLCADPAGGLGKVLKIEKTNRYQQIQLMFNYGKNDGLGWNKPGTYTFVYDVYYPEEDPSIPGTLIEPNPSAGTVQNRVANTISKDTSYNQADRGTWKTMVYTFEILTKEEVEKSGVTFDEINKGSTVYPTAHIHGFYPGDYSAADENGNYLTYYLDNLKIYYKPYTPETMNIASIRTSGNQGIRVAGFVTNTLRSMADEYGFIVTRSDLVENGDFDSFTFENQPMVYVSGKAYSKDENIDIIYCDASKNTSGAVSIFGDNAYDELGTYFTGVFIGVPKTKDAYNEKLLTRTYVKIGDTYYYGKPIEKSVYETALAVKNQYDAKGETAPEYVLEVIETAEA